MKVSTEIASISSIVGNEKAVELVAKAGFDGWDFSMTSMWNFDWGNRTFEYNPKSPLSNNDYLAYARKLRKIGEDNGIVCNQSHAPFPSHIDLFPKAEPFFKRSIECTAEAGGKICIIHPDAFATPEQNAEFYAKLLPFAKECGVKIATENMWGWDTKKDEAYPLACSPHSNFKAHLDALPDDFYVACVDIGHAEMRGTQTSAVDMIHTLGDKVQALHIHDVDLKHDNHEIPFSLNVDFEAVAKALRDIGYNGWLTLEAVHYITPNKYNADNVYDAVVDLCKSVRKFEKMVEGE